MNTPSAAAQAEIQALYDRGLFVQAFHAARRDGDPLLWREPAACILGARVLSHTGSPRAAALLILHAHRRAPADPAVFYRYLRHVLAAEGPHAALARIDEFAWTRGAPEQRADFHLLRASILADLRDFAAAEQQVRLAAALVDTPWLHCSRAHVLLAEDRVDEAIAAARTALAARPHYHPAVQVAAHALHRRGDVDESAATLTAAADALESGMLALQLAHLELARERPQAARAWIDRAAALAPCAEPGLLVMLAAMAAEAAHLAGDRTAAIRLARASGLPVAVRFAERLESGTDARRVRLPVPYVAQAHRTCGPATLAAISRYFAVPAEHLAIADEICFDGLPADSARRWAESHDFVAHEFTVTWDAAVALLDRGLPFVLATQQATSAHAQAVVGYDAARRELSLRDPTEPTLVAADADALLESQAWAGPHGMVLVPRALAHQLAGLALPDAALHDAAHAVATALRAHDRDAASTLVADLAARAPGHYVATTAARILAGYDENPAAVLAVVRDERTRHPDVDFLRILELRCRHNLGHRSERLALLTTLAADPQNPPYYAQLLAEALLRDGREHPRAEALLRRVVRRSPHEAAAYRALAVLRLYQRRWDDARTLLRFATCLDVHHSDHAHVYFHAARMAGAAAEALEFLRDRFERAGRRFSEPTEALFHALDSLGRTDESLAVLARALAWRPEDGALHLLAARAHADVGHTAEARTHLAAARGHAPEAAWQATAAHLDVLAGDLPEARARHAEILAANPLAIDAYRSIAPLDAALAGPSAALARLRAAAERFPHHAALARLLVEWTPDEGDASLDALRALQTIAPDDVEAPAELALRLGRRGRLGEAQAALDHALALGQSVPQCLAVQTQLHLWRGADELAAATARTAVSIDADAANVVAMLLITTRDAETRAAALAHLRAAIRDQVSQGPAISAYRAAALGTDPPEAILEFLRERKSAQPELVQTWTELTRQLASMDRFEEARSLAAEAVQRFPLAGDAHLALAAVSPPHSPEQIAALEAAVALAPGADAPLIALSKTLCAADQLPHALALLTDAVRRNPLAADLHDELALTLHRHGDRPAALARLITALERDPSSLERWDLLARMARAHGEEAAARDAAARLARERPLCAGARYGVAALTPDDQPEARLAALAEVLGLEPRMTAVHDERARLLASLGRFDEALAACTPGVSGERQPMLLRGRAAWILRERGHHTQAHRDMHAVVADHPDYTFGWACLAEWARVDGRIDHQIAALRQLLRIDPDAAPFARDLLELQLTTGRLRDVAHTIAALRRAGEPHHARLAEVRVAFIRDTTQGLREFDRLACEPGVPPELVTEAADLVVHHTSPEHLDAHLRRLVQSYSAQPVVGFLWARWISLDIFHAWSLRPFLRALRTRGEIGEEATRAYLLRLTLLSPLSLILHVAAERPALRATDSLWATTGAAMLAHGRPAAAREWLADWQSRQNLDPWMLSHVALALRWSGHDAEARAASEQALAKGSPTIDHPLWVAFDHALAGAHDEAHTALAPISQTPTTDAYDRWLLAATKALTAALSPTLTPTQRRAAIAGYLDEARTCGATRRQWKVLRRLHTRVKRHIAALA